MKERLVAFSDAMEKMRSRMTEEEKQAFVKGIMLGTQAVQALLKDAVATTEEIANLEFGMDSERNINATIRSGLTKMREDLIEFRKTMEKKQETMTEEGRYAFRTGFAAGTQMGLEMLDDVLGYAGR